jgi:hypothetical protein
MAICICKSRRNSHCTAHGGFTRKTPQRSFKKLVLLGLPGAKLDYYESLRGSGRPCWFVREGLQGEAYTPICGTPRAAWKAAFAYIRECMLAGSRKAAA